MRVTIKYSDDDALTMEEVVKLAHHNYGNKATVIVEADSPAPHDLIYFALQTIVTPKQISILFDSKEEYQTKLSLLRAEILSKVAEILDSVIIDNEDRVVK
jgi:hypothetical protein